MGPGQLPGFIYSKPDLFQLPFRAGEKITDIVFFNRGNGTFCPPDNTLHISSTGLPGETV